MARCRGCAPSGSQRLSRWPQFTGTFFALALAFTICHTAAEGVALSPVKKYAGEGHGHEKPHQNWFRGGRGLIRDRLRERQRQNRLVEHTRDQTLTTPAGSKTSGWAVEDDRTPTSATPVVAATVFAAPPPEHHEAHDRRKILEQHELAKQHGAPEHHNTPEQRRIQDDDEDSKGRDGIVRAEVLPEAHADGLAGRPQSLKGTGVVAHARAVGHNIAKQTPIGELRHSPERLREQEKQRLHGLSSLLPVPEDNANSSEPILLFFAVGAQERVMSLVMKNVDHARDQLEDVSVYLAHYDSKRQAWLSRMGAWYDDNVDFWAERPGFKFQLMQKLMGRGKGFNLARYKWIWALDEDCDFTGTKLPRMVRLADASGSMLTIPAFTELGQSARDRQLSFPVQEPHPECQYRYSPVVEVIFPLIRPEALDLILNDCEHCIHDSTVWGLDDIWCSWTARQLNRPKFKACAIIDETYVIHRNFKTLKDKYDSSGKPNLARRDGIAKAFHEKSYADAADVKRWHKEDWAEDTTGSRQFEMDTVCVPRPAKAWDAEARAAVKAAQEAKAAVDRDSKIATPSKNEVPLRWRR